MSLGAVNVFGMCGLLKEHFYVYNIKKYYPNLCIFIWSTR